MNIHKKALVLLTAIVLMLMGCGKEKMPRQTEDVSKQHDEILSEIRSEHKELLKRVDIFIKLEQYQEAYKQLDEAIKLDPGDQTLRIAMIYLLLHTADGSVYMPTGEGSGDFTIIDEQLDQFKKLDNYDKYSEILINNLLKAEKQIGEFRLFYALRKFESKKVQQKIWAQYMEDIKYRKYAGEYLKSIEDRKYMKIAAVEEEGSSIYDKLTDILYKSGYDLLSHYNDNYNILKAGAEKLKSDFYKKECKNALEKIASKADNFKTAEYSGLQNKLASLSSKNIDKQELYEFYKFKKYLKHDPKADRLYETVLKLYKEHIDSLDYDSMVSESRFSERDKKYYDPEFIAQIDSLEQEYTASVFNSAENIRTKFNNYADKCNRKEAFSYAELAGIKNLYQEAQKLPDKCVDKNWLTKTYVIFLSNALLDMSQKQSTDIAKATQYYNDIIENTGYNDAYREKASIRYTDIKKYYCIAAINDLKRWIQNNPYDYKDFYEKWKVIDKYTTYGSSLNEELQKIKNFYTDSYGTYLLASLKIWIKDNPMNLEEFRKKYEETNEFCRYGTENNDSIGEVKKEFYSKYSALRYTEILKELKEPPLDKLVLKTYYEELRPYLGYNAEVYNAFKQKLEEADYEVPLMVSDISKDNSEGNLNNFEILVLKNENNKLYAYDVYLDSTKMDCGVHSVAIGIHKLKVLKRDKDALINIVGGIESIFGGKEKELTFNGNEKVTLTITGESLNYYKLTKEKLD